MDKQIILTLRGDDSSLPDSFGDSLHFGICALSVLSCICWPAEACVLVCRLPRLSVPLNGTRGCPALPMVRRGILSKLGVRYWQAHLFCRTSQARISN